jgi:hypothetical protein
MPKAQDRSSRLDCSQRRQYSPLEHLTPNECARRGQNRQTAEAAFLWRQLSPLASVNADELPTFTSLMGD